VVCYEGYVTPARKGAHTVGASFQPKSTDASLSLEDHHENLKKLRNAMPALSNTLSPEEDTLTTQALTALQGRTAFRCQSPDYLPIVGPLPIADYFMEDYQGLSKGSRYTLYPKGRYYPHLYINVAHGSRGLTTSNFTAELISAYITGEPANMDREVIEAIHPTRFLIREIRRRRSSAPS